ncbi:hypothetical protein [Campylobacter curvus]|uniref:Uncharacterized protein n=1 Tax=Campylobacter curvus (strain 525.92) TaxID=360105 RepID=A7H0U6_CAMC5|nr:hypothetical protein [Campylobacter curvus]EAU00359.1 hypothetical protein CCV52592_0035 [Campylobacter curvus 525.92]
MARRTNQNGQNVQEAKNTAIDSANEAPKNEEQEATEKSANETTLQDGQDAVASEPNTTKQPKTEIWVFIRGDELGQKGEILYEFALKSGFREAIKTAQEIAGVEQNGVMSAEALAAINAVDDTEFKESFEFLAGIRG